ncbi:hypothetical protein KQ693_10370 [Thermus sp. PS18]|uniref:hypothetical protein n=1 Tax=Thermus sp. PS18 TaxID=2849039 RepID=UPI0022647E96|nr:hypothetical protein [Thermus sp. PS18]UZX15020.1 hypothetical protein KQ693_10370 [Thermus sp. PS18]
MDPRMLLRRLRADPGTPYRLRIRGLTGEGTVFLKWEGGGVMFWLRPLRLWDGPYAEPKALEVMGPWRVLEFAPAGKEEVA